MSGVRATPSSDRAYSCEEWIITVIHEPSGREQTTTLMTDVLLGPNVVSDAIARAARECHYHHLDPKVWEKHERPRKDA